MNNKNLEKIINVCGDFVESRLEEGYKQYSKTQDYNKYQKEYSELRQILLKDISEDKLEQLENAIYKLNTIEVNYSYLQGFLDGTLLRETLDNK